MPESKARAGWSVVGLTTPSATASVGFAVIFLLVASTPPASGGDYIFPNPGTTAIIDAALLFMIELPREVL